MASWAEYSSVVEFKNMWNSFRLEVALLRNVECTFVTSFVRLFPYSRPPTINTYLDRLSFKTCTRELILVWEHFHLNKSPARSYIPSLFAASRTFLSTNLIPFRLRGTALFTFRFTVFWRCSGRGGGGPGFTSSSDHFTDCLNDGPSSVPQWNISIIF